MPSTRSTICTSPDLDVALANIANERNAQERRRRANALLGCLARNWDRLEAQTKVSAMSTGGQWVRKGHVDAWWISSAASLAWLSNGRGKPTAPGQVRLRTTTNEAMHGADPAQYLADGYDVPANREVLTALGVEGNPTVTALLARLALIRSASHAGTPLDGAPDGSPAVSAEGAADLSAPIYKALTSEVQITGTQRRIGNMTVGAARTAFDRGDGLIITSLGWRRTSAVFSGPPIFGDLEPFVPAVSGADSLWSVLGVRPPGIEDAKRVLRQLARQRILDIENRQIMLEALRLLAAGPPDRVGQLRRVPVYVGDGWLARRPVFAVANPLFGECSQRKDSCLATRRTAGSARGTHRAARLDTTRRG
jgi:hypothetical protein